MPSLDYEEFIDALGRHGVRYLIVGAHAVAHHARPRATKDLDIFIEPIRANAGRVLAAMTDFFDGTAPGYTEQELIDPAWIIQLGVAPVRIDLISSLLGCPSFRLAWKNRVEGQFGSAPTHYLGLDDLIKRRQPAACKIKPTFVFSNEQRVVIPQFDESAL